MQVLGYIRVSTSKQVDDQTPELQGWQISEYCAKHNHNLIALYIDGGRTGTAKDDFVPNDIESLEFRPAIIAMFDHLKRDPWGHNPEGVIVSKRDRWARDPFIADYLGRRLKQLKKRFLTVRRGFVDGNTVEDVILNGSEDMYSKIEAIMIKERTMDGKKKNASKGFFVGHSIPYGFRSASVTDDKRRSILVPDEEESRVVKYIFKLRERRMSLKKIAFRLDAEQIPPPKKKWWSYTTIWYILHNPIYQGIVRYGDIKVNKPEVAIVEAMSKTTKIAPRKSTGVKSLQKWAYKGGTSE